VVVKELIALGLVCGLMTSGCGAGQVTQTSSQRSAVSGASGDVGDIALRDAWIPAPEGRTPGYPPGSSLPLMATVVNAGRGPDELLAVSSPDAGQVLMTGKTLIPPHRNVVSGDTTPPVSPLVSGTLRIVLITSRFVPTGFDVPVTFRFRDAGQVIVPVPLVQR
jgi:hypothetical protein